MKITLVNPPYPPSAHQPSTIHPPRHSIFGRSRGESRTRSQRHRLPSRKTNLQHLPQPHQPSQPRHRRSHRHHTTIQLSKTVTHHSQTSPPKLHNHDRRKPRKLLGRKRTARMPSTGHRGPQRRRNNLPRTTRPHTKQTKPRRSFRRNIPHTKTAHQHATQTDPSSKT